MIGMKLAAILFVPFAASCAPAQDVGLTAKALTQAIDACAQPLTKDGSIDQAALTKKGWRVVSRTVMMNGTERKVPLDAYPALKSYETYAEYEETRWTRSGSDQAVTLIRATLPTGNETRSHDYCSSNVSINRPDDAAKIKASLAAFIGRDPDKIGTGPRGGDFLTPRFDKAPTISHWALPQHNIFLRDDNDEQLRLEIIGIPDFTTLTRFSPDSVENRIPSGDPIK